MYIIRRPPAHLKSFEMPTQEDLINLKRNSLVKVIFQDSRYLQDPAERMWCKIDKIDDDGWVDAKLDNKPWTVSCLRLKDPVKFHVTDIIQIWEDR